jgi:casein kinase 1
MPKIWGGGQQGQLDYIVMDLLGPSLDNLYRKNGKKPFDVRSVCTVAIQMACYVQIDSHPFLSIFS